MDAEVALEHQDPAAAAVPARTQLSRTAVGPPCRATPWPTASSTTINTCWTPVPKRGKDSRPNSSAQSVPALSSRTRMMRDPYSHAADACVRGLRCRGRARSLRCRGSRGMQAGPRGAGVARPAPGLVRGSSVLARISHRNPAVNGLDGGDIQRRRGEVVETLLRVRRGRGGKDE